MLPCITEMSRSNDEDRQPFISTRCEWPDKFFCTILLNIK